MARASRDRAVQLFTLDPGRHALVIETPNLPRPRLMEVIWPDAVVVLATLWNEILLYRTALPVRRMILTWIEATDLLGGYA